MFTRHATVLSGIKIRVEAATVAKRRVPRDTKEVGLDLATLLNQELCAQSSVQPSAPGLGTNYTRGATFRMRPMTFIFEGVK